MFTGEPKPPPTTGPGALPMDPGAGPVADNDPVSNIIKQVLGAGAPPPQPPPGGTISPPAGPSGTIMPPGGPSGTIAPSMPSPRLPGADLPSDPGAGPVAENDPAGTIIKTLLGGEGAAAPGGAPPPSALSKPGLTAPQPGMLSKIGSAIGDTLGPEGPVAGASDWLNQQIASLFGDNTVTKTPGAPPASGGAEMFAGAPRIGTGGTPPPPTPPSAYQAATAGTGEDEFAKFSQEHAAPPALAPSPPTTVAAPRVTPGGAGMGVPPSSLSKPGTIGLPGPTSTAAAPTTIAPAAAMPAPSSVMPGSTDLPARSNAPAPAPAPAPPPSGTIMSPAGPSGTIFDRATANTPTPRIRPTVVSASPVKPTITTTKTPAAAARVTASTGTSKSSAPPTGSTAAFAKAVAAAAAASRPGGSTIPIGNMSGDDLRAAAYAAANP
jgi:hypothetical protein